MCCVLCAVSCCINHEHDPFDCSARINGAQGANPIAGVVHVPYHVFNRLTPGIWVHDHMHMMTGGEGETEGQHARSENVQRDIEACNDMDTECGLLSGAVCVCMCARCARRSEVRGTVYMQTPPFYLYTCRFR